MAVLTSYLAGDDSYIAQDGADIELAQTFTLAAAASVNKIVVKIFRVGNPGNGSMSIVSLDGEGKPDVTGFLKTVVFNANILTTDTDGELRELGIGIPTELTAGSYALWLQGGDNGANSINWRVDSSSSAYTGGKRFHSTDYGANWTNHDTHDFIFSLEGDSAPIKATNPAPTDAASDVTLDQETVTWEDGGGATSYNVYYGDTSGALTLVSEGQAGLSFTVNGATLGSPYDYIVTRYWRIDSINATGTTTGDEWSFITIRFTPPSPTHWYVTGSFYYRLLVDGDGNLGDPPPGGVEDTDYVIVAGPPSPNNTPSRLVIAANNTIFYEDV